MRIRGGQKLEQLEQIEEAVRLVASGVETLASCPLRYGSLWPQIEPQVRLSLTLSALGEQHRTSVGATFDREAIRTKLDRARRSALADPANTSIGAGAADSGSNPGLKPPKVIEYRKPLWNRFREWCKPRTLIGKAALALLLVLFGSSLFVWGAEASDPGDLLYGAKMQLEAVPEALNFSPQARAEARLAYAQRRLNEIERAVAQNNNRDLSLAAESYRRAVSEALDNSGQNQAGPLRTRLEQHQAALAILENRPALNPRTRAQLLNLMAQNQMKLRQATPTQSRSTPSTQPQSTTRNYPNAGATVASPNSNPKSPEPSSATSAPPQREIHPASNAPTLPPGTSRIPQSQQSPNKALRPRAGTPRAEPATPKAGTTVKPESTPHAQLTPQAEPATPKVRSTPKAEATVKVEPTPKAEVTAKVGSTPEKKDESRSNLKRADNRAGLRQAKRN